MPRRFTPRNDNNHIAKKLASYLGQLKFDRKLENSFIARYLRNPRLVILVILLLLLIGGFSLSSIPRVLNPDVNIPIVIVSTGFPGAGPQDVESLVTIPVEDAVMGVDNVKTVTSTSQDSSSVVEVEFNDGTDPDKARTDIQSAVDQVSGLPTDSLTPSVQKIDFQNIPVWTFIVTGKTDDASLNRFSKILSDNIKNVATVKSVSTSGLDDQEVQIVIKPSTLTTYDLNPQQISQAIKTAISSFPAGTVMTGDSSFSLTINSQIQDVQDIRNLELTLGGKPVSLGDIANVYEKSKPDEFQSFYATTNLPATHGVTFSVFKTDAASIDQAVSDTKKVANSTLQQYNNQFHIASVSDVGEQIDKQFSDLYRDFSITIGLVFITLFIFVGLRQAIIALLSTPLTFMITFTVMNVTGISLSFIAVFSLLLSLGLLVDDTIVMISAMTAYYRTGRFTSYQAALLVWRDFLPAVTTTTITTVWAFLPLLLASGIIADFIKAIPIVVSSTLIGSYLVAIFITLPAVMLILNPNIPNRVKVAGKILLAAIVVFVLFSLLPKGRLFLLELLALIAFLFVLVKVYPFLWQNIKKSFQKRTRKNALVKNMPYYMNHGIIHFEIVSEKYKALMSRVLSSPKIRKQILIMVIIFSLFSYLLLPLGFVVNEFFPATPADSLSVTLEMPVGTNVQTTTRDALQLLDTVRKNKNLQFVSLDVGSEASSGFGGGSSGGNIASLSLVLPPASERKEDSITVAENLREQLATWPTGTVQVVEASNGPPAGADVQIKLFGNDLNTLDAYANKVETYLQKQPGVTNIDKSIKPGTSKIVFVPDTAKLVQNNLTVDQVGSYLRLFASGMKADDIQFSNDIGTTKTDIMIRMTTGDEFVNSLDSINIPTMTGSVPLAALGTLQLQANPTLITREAGQRTISVSASVTKGYNVTQINQKLGDYANGALSLPAGYSWTTGGANETNQESVLSILQAMLLSFLLIIITMVVQFGSFRKALIVMLVIPLSISGVFVLFALTHTPLSFPALIGVLALFGIVVKNSILIVDKINQNYRIGMDHIEAVVDAASSRLEPIALTSFATIMGLIPITLSDPLWRGLGGAIIAGLAFSGTIMLFFIPVVYYYWFRNDHSLDKKA